MAGVVALPSVQFYYLEWPSSSALRGSPGPGPTPNPPARGAPAAPGGRLGGPPPTAPFCPHSPRSLLGPAAARGRPPRAPVGPSVGAGDLHRGGVRDGGRPTDRASRDPSPGRDPAVHVPAAQGNDTRAPRPDDRRPGVVAAERGLERGLGGLTIGVGPAGPSGRGVGRRVDPPLTPPHVTVSGLLRGPAHPSAAAAAAAAPPSLAPPAASADDGATAPGPAPERPVPPRAAADDPSNHLRLPTAAVGAGMSLDIRRHGGGGGGGRGVGGDRGASAGDDDAVSTAAVPPFTGGAGGGPGSPAGGADPTGWGWGGVGRLSPSPAGGGVGFDGGPGSGSAAGGPGDGGGALRLPSLSGGSAAAFPPAPPGALSPGLFSSRDSSLSGGWGGGGVVPAAAGAGAAGSSAGAASAAEAGQARGRRHPLQRRGSHGAPGFLSGGASPERAGGDLWGTTGTAPAGGPVPLAAPLPGPAAGAGGGGQGRYGGGDGGVGAGSAGGGARSPDPLAALRRSGGALPTGASSSLPRPPTGASGEAGPPLLRGGGTPLHGVHRGGHAGLAAGAGGARGGVGSGSVDADGPRPPLGWGADLDGADEGGRESTLGPESPSARGPLPLRPAGDCAGQGPPSAPPGCGPRGRPWSMAGHRNPVHTPSASSVEGRSAIEGEGSFVPPPTAGAGSLESEDSTRAARVAAG